MAVVSVSANNTRRSNMDTTNNIRDIGGGSGAGVEVDFFYQGIASVSRRSKSFSGFALEDPTPQDMTATNRRHVIFKLLATTKDALLPRTAPGLLVRIGSNRNNYYSFYLEGSDTYPIKGGWLIRPVSPNVVAYRGATTGTPVLTSIGYIGLAAEFSEQSKAENLAMDAIDIGQGLNLVGGDGADSDGSFQDFVDFDEGTNANRYGYVSTLEGILQVYGTLAIGETPLGTATTTEFIDTNSIIVFPDGWFETGFSGILINLNVSTTLIDISNGSFIGRGSNTIEDTRPVLNIIGTAGSVAISDSLFENFSELLLTSSTTITGGTITRTQFVNQNSANIDGVLFSGSPTGSGVALLLSNDPSRIQNSVFNSGGAGHAIEMSVPGIYTFSGNKFNNYGLDETNNSAIYNNSGGAITLNITNGGTTPSVRNGAGSTTIVNNNVSITLTGLKDETEIRVYSSGTTTELAGIENVSSGLPDNRTFTFSLPPGVDIDIVIMSITYQYIRIENFTVPPTNTSIPVSQVIERSYSNPV